MKVAVVGSRGININDLERYLPAETEEIISGGARGVDSCAAAYAVNNGIKLTVIRPNYDKHGRSAPIIRNIDIINRADFVIAFWDGVSRGTKFVIDRCEGTGKDIEVHIVSVDPA